MFEHDYKKFPELTNRQLQEMQFSSPHKQYTEDFEAEVVKVHDGDTFTIRTNDRDFDFPIRLVDVDCPELNEGGEIARDFVKNWILNKKVSISINPQKRVGKYGRLLADVICGGVSISEMLLALGYALPFGKRRENKIQPMSFVLRYDDLWRKQF